VFGVGARANPGVDVVAKQRVLLVDDDRDTRTVLRAILERQKIRVFEAENGTKGVLAARKRKPDLIIVDIRMPGMDGIEACRAIKTDAALRAIPILILSGAMRRAKLDQFVELERVSLYDEFLAKPFEYRDLLAIVNRRLAAG